MGLFRKRPVDITDAARAMRQKGIDSRKAKVRAMCDQMRRDMGMEPLQWPN